MGKRSEFERVEKDFYPTFDLRAGKRLVAHLNPLKEIKYAEPCYGEGDLEVNLTSASSLMKCQAKGDIESGKDLFDWSKEDVVNCDLIITNPPWSRSILHPLIEYLAPLKPTWLLFDSDWAYTKQARPYMDYCTDILAIGRLVWMRDTKISGKDNCSWYRFSTDKDEATRFYAQI